MATQPIIQRKYSLAEIDEMRKLILECKPIFENGCMYYGAFFFKKTLDEAQERELRTLMMAGVTPDELDGHYKSIVDKYLTAKPETTE